MQRKPARGFRWLALQEHPNQETTLPEGTLRVVAHMYAKPGKEEELRSLLLGLIAPTRKEPGCIKYELHGNQENPSEFAFIEEWTDGSALDAEAGIPGPALQICPDRSRAI